MAPSDKGKDADDEMKPGSFILCLCSGHALALLRQLEMAKKQGHSSHHDNQANHRVY
jgi:hypothetical protein